MQSFEVFFDGACPLCRREIEFLRRRDRKEQIRFTDISQPGLDFAALGKSYGQLMARIHGRLPDGTWVEGVEVFRHLYQATGFGPLVTITRFWGLSHVFDAAYNVFAKNRLRWTGRTCDEACAVAPTVQS